MEMKMVLLTTLIMLTLVGTLTTATTLTVNAQNMTENTNNFASCGGIDFTPPCIAADGTITYGCDDEKYVPTAWNPCAYLRGDGTYDIKMPTADLAGAEAEEFKGSEQGNLTLDTYAGCEDTGYVAPCMEAGELIVYCDDPVLNNSGLTCMPSPKDWAEFLPSCKSVNFGQSCSREITTGQRQALFTCDDPEFNPKKYPQGCIDASNANTIVVLNQVPDNNKNNNDDDNDNDDNDKSKSISNSNNKDATITVAYGDVSSYYGKGKVVIKNLETGRTLVTHDLNFAKQHNSQGDNCCVKTYTFDDSNTQYGDRISAKVTGGGGSWETGTYDYKKNLRISISLEEIGEDVDGNFVEYNKDSLKKCSSSDGSPPCIENDNTISYSCDDVRHFNSQDERCIYWNKKNGNWDVRFTLTGGDYKNITDSNNDNDNDNKKPLKQPTPQDWADFLPNCDDVNWNESCSDDGKAMFTCDDPEFNFDQYPQGCITVTDQGEDTDEDANEDRENSKDNNDGQEQFELPPEEEPAFEDEVTGNISSS